MELVFWCREASREAIHKATSDCSGRYKGGKQDPQRVLKWGKTENFRWDGREGLSDKQIFHSSPD